MKEYIEREEAMNIAFKSPFFSDALMEEMKAIPSADVAPVRHGKWVHDYNNRYTCTECLNREVMSTKHMKPFCPECGARMDGDCHADG